MLFLLPHPGYYEWLGSIVFSSKGGVKLAWLLMAQQGCWLEPATLARGKYFHLQLNVHGERRMRILLTS